MSKRRHRNGRHDGPNDWVSDELDDTNERRDARHNSRQRERRREERRRERRSDTVAALTRVPAEPDASPSWAESLFSPFVDHESRTGPTCGACRNWITHREPGGRGTCDHPGSGFLYPFEDTAACPFFEQR